MSSRRLITHRGGKLRSSPAQSTMEYSPKDQSTMLKRYESTPSDKEEIERLKRELQAQKNRLDQEVQTVCSRNPNLYDLIKAICDSGLGEDLGYKTTSKIDNENWIETKRGRVVDIAYLIYKACPDYIAERGIDPPKAQIADALKSVKDRHPETRFPEIINKEREPANRDTWPLEEVDRLKITALIKPAARVCKARSFRRYVDDENTMNAIRKEYEFGYTEAINRRERRRLREPDTRNIIID